MDGALVMAELGPIAKKPLNQRTSEWIHGNVVEPISNAMSYYAGPHLSESLGRIGQAGDVASYFVPGIGDAKDMGETYANYVGNQQNDAGWGQTAWDLGMMGLAAAPFLPMASKVDDVVDVANTMRTADALPKGKAKKASALGPIGSKWYHGTNDPDFALRDNPLFMSQNSEEAEAFPKMWKNLGAKSGSPTIKELNVSDGPVQNIDDLIFDAMENGDDIDDVIRSAAKEYKTKGVEFLEFMHPSSLVNGEDYVVRVAISPQKTVKFGPIGGAR
jgi:hypothetical protein